MDASPPDAAADAKACWVEGAEKSAALARAGRASDAPVPMNPEVELGLYKLDGGRSAERSHAERAFAIDWGRSDALQSAPTAAAARNAVERSAKPRQREPQAEWVQAVQPAQAEPEAAAQ